MIRFSCDYEEGAMPEVLDALLRTNAEQTAPYGTDVYCDTARGLIRDLCRAPHAGIHFLVGGTQTNTVVIDAALRPHQGVIAAVSGHIATHESGAIEAIGHKVLTVPSDDGKLTADEVREVYRNHWADSTHEHQVQPAMVYISQPTETGTLYGKAELEALSAVCRECGLLLYMDGARMGYGLASEANDLSPADLAAYTDAFTFGGTKQGLLFGEALVVTNSGIDRDLRYLIKQHGGLLAKGRLLGVQYAAAFAGGKDAPYFSYAHRADVLAMKLRRAFIEAGIPLLYDSYTNQQYPIFPNAVLARLEENYVFSFWCRTDATHTAVRVCTSWATAEDAVDRLIRDLNLAVAENV